eukprot:7503847-Alexandrium_andersonii.AAC.1
MAKQAAARRKYRESCAASSTDGGDMVDIIINHKTWMIHKPSVDHPLQPVARTCGKRGRASSTPGISAATSA